MLKNTAFLCVVALVACDGEALDGRVELHFRHYGLDRYAAGADSYELALTVETPDGATLARTTVLTELGGFEDVVMLPCSAGDELVARATMIAAYEGRPHGLRGGRGGLEHHPYTASQRFTCSSGSPAEVTWPGADSVTEPELPWATSGTYVVRTDVVLPDALRDHAVRVIWDFDYQSPPYAWRWVADSWAEASEAAVSSDYIGCYAEDDTLSVVARPLVVEVDQVPLPRDTWRLPTLTATAPACVVDEDVAVPLEATLELLPEVTP